MTEEIVCHNSKCKYKERHYLNECVDCELSEQIEHDLTRDKLYGGEK